MMRFERVLHYLLYLAIFLTTSLSTENIFGRYYCNWDVEMGRRICMRLYRLQEIISEYKEKVNIVIDGVS